MIVIILVGICHGGNVPVSHDDDDDDNDDDEEGVS